MKKNPVIFNLLLFFIFSSLNGQELVPQKRIPISDTSILIQHSSGLIITNDSIAVLDSKAGDVKLFDFNGSHIKNIGRRGPGPGEFHSPLRADYLKNKLYIYDFGLFKLSAFVEKETNEFNFDFSKTVIGAYNLKVTPDDTILIAGHVKSPQGPYELYSIDPKTNDKEYWLPHHVKYGDKSEAESRKRIAEYSHIGVFSYLHLTEKTIFYVWEGCLSLIQIDINTKKIIRTDLSSQYYQPPKVTKRWRDYYSKPGKGHIVQEEKQRYSFVTGLFGKENWIGILIKNYDQLKEGWWPTVLIYNLKSENLSEYPLEDIIYFPKGQFPHAFSQNTNLLYLLSSVLEDTFIKHEIHTLKILE